MPRNSNFSWAFYAYGGFFGSPATASTANESFVVTGTDHSNLVYAFADLLTKTYWPSPPVGGTIGAEFQLSRLLAGDPNNQVWEPNMYDSSGQETIGPFDAVLATASNGKKVSTLSFVSAATGEQVTYT